MHDLRRLIDVSTRDLQCFYGSNLLNDNCVNAYLRLVERRSFYFNSIPHVYAFDTFFFSAWANGKYEKVKRWTKSVNIFARDVLLFPLHVVNIGEEGHWSLIVVWTKTKQIITYDSFGLHYPERAETILAYLQEEATTKKVLFDPSEWKILETPPNTPRQKDSTSCGVYVCLFAEMLTRKSTLENLEVDTKHLRKELSSSLRRGKIGGENFQLLEPPLSQRLLFEPMTNPVVQLETFISQGRKSSIIIPSDPVVEAINLELNKLASPARLTPTFTIAEGNLTKEEKIDSACPEVEEKQCAQQTTGLDDAGEDVLFLNASDEELEDTADSNQRTEEGPQIPPERPVTKGDGEKLNPTDVHKKGQRQYIRFSTAAQGTEAGPTRRRRMRPARVKVWQEDGTFKRMSVAKAKVFSYVLRHKYNHF